MKVYLRATGRLLAERVVLANTFFTRLRGLIGRRLKSTDQRTTLVSLTAAGRRFLRKAGVESEARYEAEKGRPRFPGLPRSWPFTVMLVVPPRSSRTEMTPSPVNERPSPARRVTEIGEAVPTWTTT